MGARRRGRRDPAPVPAITLARGSPRRGFFSGGHLPSGAALARSADGAEAARRGAAQLGRITDDRRGCHSGAANQSGALLPKRDHWKAISPQEHCSCSDSPKTKYLHPSMAPFGLELLSTKLLWGWLGPMYA
uniref:Uncharacterized protein n=1 Tax=Oryza rufipogon TaxID=4529 RepID=A0A0E0RAY6_ORYRU